MPSLPFGNRGNRRHPSRDGRLRTTSSLPSRYMSPGARPTTGRTADGLREPQEPREVPWRLIARAAASLGLVVAVLGGGTLLYRSDLLRVDGVRVVGAQVVDSNAVIEAAQVGDGSLLRLDTDKVSERVEALSGIAEARVHRDWPGTVVIDITERQAWGYWQSAGIRSVVDSEGRVVDRSRPPAQNAPTVYEVSPGQQALKVGATVDRDTIALVTRLESDGTYQRLGMKPARYEFDRSKGLVIRMDKGAAAVFGDSHDYEFKVAAWVATSARIKADRMTANEIDLRFGKELVVR